MTFRDQDSRSRLEVQVRGETETRLSKMCLETVSRTETGLENYITTGKDPSYFEAKSFRNPYDYFNFPSTEMVGKTNFVSY